MAFEILTDKLTAAIQKLRGQKTVSEQDLKETLREVRLALLEADVNFKVVKEFTAKIRERAMGQQVDPNLTPGQYIVKIVHEELIELLGGTQSKLNVAANPPTVIMLVGLQGAGKTTTVGKLANYLRKNGKKPLMVAGDVYRPAAITQLEVIGKQLDMPVFSMGDQVSPVEIARESLKRANALLCDTVLIDTAGRLHNKKNLMEELRKIYRILEREYPEAYLETLVVLDGTTGQNALAQAKQFAEVANVTGIILTKLDGTAKGGIAVAIQSELDIPVKYIGVGETIDDLQKFDADTFVNALFDVNEKED